MQTRYVLLTAAKNEEAYIGTALESVVRQTSHPAAWIIVDDGSTDRTADIVREYAARYPFIRLRTAGDASARRSFGSKDKAINAAYATAKESDFDLIGIQDADIAPERADYYERVVGHFESNPKLGVAGGYICERMGGAWLPRKGNAEDSVAGGIQMFRRVCYDQIGGYIPLDCGGEDWLAQLQARMAGWEVAAWPQYRILHYRPTSSAGGKWRGFFRLGLMDASFGSHPLFEIFKCGRRLLIPPFVAGGLVRFSGYLWWRLAGRKPVLTHEQVAFLREEQIAKVRGFFSRGRTASPCRRGTASA